MTGEHVSFPNNRVAITKGTPVVARYLLVES